MSCSCHICYDMNKTGCRHFFYYIMRFPNVYIMIFFISKLSPIDSSLPNKNCRHFVDCIFRCIFVNKTFCVLLIISMKSVPRSPMDSIGADNDLAPNRRQAIIWANADPIQWHIHVYVALVGRLGFTHWGRVTHICVGNLIIIGHSVSLLGLRKFTHS